MARFAEEPAALSTTSRSDGTAVDRWRLTSDRSPWGRLSQKWRDLPVAIAGPLAVARRAGGFLASRTPFGLERGKWTVGAHFLL
jgi:hypothetical protein